MPRRLGFTIQNSFPLNETVPADYYNKVVKSLTAQRKYAWFRYYEAMEQRLETATTIIRFLPVPPPPRPMEQREPPVIPPHITQEFYEMACALRKEFNCPVCWEMVTKDTIILSNCGHIYCKECHHQLQTTSNKCALCRKALGGAGGAEGQDDDE